MMPAGYESKPQCRVTNVSVAGASTCSTGDKITTVPAVMMLDSHDGKRNLAGKCHCIKVGGRCPNPMAYGAPTLWHIKTSREGAQFLPLLGDIFLPEIPLRDENSITRDSRLGCLTADKMPALQKLDVTQSPFLTHHFAVESLECLSEKGRFAWS
jgi:hypothetical protein